MAPIRLKWTPELVAKFWDGFSHTKLTEFSFARQAGIAVTVAIKHMVSEDTRVVDFGAGDGDLVEVMLDRGFQVAAYEPSVERARKIEARLSGKSGFLGTVGANDNAQFDIVLMTEVIEHILDEELEVTLQRVSSLIKEGGILVVTTPNAEDLELGMAYCPVSNVLFHRWQHVRSFTGDSLRELLSRFDLQEVVTHFVSFDYGIFGPFDPNAGAAEMAVPDFLTKLWKNEPVRIGSETNILYVGRKLNLR